MSPSVSEAVQVAVRSHEGVTSAWRFAYHTTQTGSCVVEASGPSGERFSAAGSDFYTALQQLRRESLEPAGLFPLCVGARVDAVTSGLLVSMFKGLTVYLVRKHFQAYRRAHLFDPAPFEKVGSVGAQEAFFRQWASSMRFPAWIANPRLSLRVAWSRVDLRRTRTITNAEYMARLEREAEGRRDDAAPS